MRFKINWASLIVTLEVNLPFLLCFTLYLRTIFQVQGPRGVYIWRGDFTEGFLHYQILGGGGDYIWRGYFRNFTYLFIYSFILYLTLKHGQWVEYGRVQYLGGLQQKKDHYTSLGICPVTPPLSQHFAQSEK